MKKKQRELLILLELRKNSRNSSVEISKNANIPLSTTTDKLKKLNQTTIQKNISLINFNNVGYNTRVILIIKTNNKEKLKTFLLNKQCINSISRINNKSFLIEAIFKNLKELEEFKEKVYNIGIEELKIHHVIEEIKKEDFLTKQDHLSLINS